MLSSGLIVASVLCAAVVSTAAGHRRLQGRSELEQTEVIVSNLMRGHNKDVRPFGPDGNSGDNVTVGYTITSINNVDTKNNQLETSGYLMMSWKDQRLAFGASYYTVSKIRIDSSKIWTPDMELYNAAGSGVQRLNWNPKPTMAVVYGSGDVLVVPQITTRSTCNATDGNTGRVVCELQFGSWVYSGLEMDINAGTFDTGSYKPNPHWDLTRTSVRRDVKTYACCPEPYTNLAFSMELQYRHE